jgi:hypothetical protein
MAEEIDKHVLRKYDVQQKLGKGVRGARRRGGGAARGAAAGRPRRSSPKKHRGSRRNNVCVFAGLTPRRTHARAGVRHRVEGG